MAFFNSAVGVLQTLVVALGAGLGIWGAINLLERRTTSGGRRLCADRSGESSHFSFVNSSCKVFNLEPHHFTFEIPSRKAYNLRG